MASVLVAFYNAGSLPLAYTLTPQAHAGYSEGVAATKAYAALAAADRAAIVDFLRAQVIDDSPAEGVR